MTTEILQPGRIDTNFNLVSQLKLIKRRKLSKADGTYLKELGKFLKVDLNILDDFDSQSFDNHARENTYGYHR